MRFKVADFLIMIAFVFVVVELAVLTVLDVLEMKAEKLVDPNNLYQTLFPLTALNDKDWSRYMKVFTPRYSQIGRTAGRGLNILSLS